MSTGDETLRRLEIPVPSRSRVWMFRGLIGAVGLAVVLVVGLFVWRARSASGQRFETVRVARGDIVSTVTATGSLRPRRVVDVGPVISGRIASVRVDVNDRVHMGDVLAELDTTQLVAALGEARANVASAEAAVSLSRSTLTDARVRSDRSTQLRQHDLESAADHQTATAAVSRGEADILGARARLELARASLSRAQADLDHAQILAPIDGIVMTRAAETGQPVAAQFQAQVLFQVAEDLSRMELHVDVDEADVGRVHQDQHATFTVDAYPERVFQATITRLAFASHIVDRVVAYEGVLAVDNRDLALRPGMTATATIETGRRTQVLVIPNRALRFVPPAPPRFGGPRPQLRPDGHTVYVLRRGEPASQTVRVGGTDGTRTEISGENVHEGMEVVVGVHREGS